MGCQKDIQDEFKFAKLTDTNTEYALDHGRIETRTCNCIKDFKFIPVDNHWLNLNTIIRIESTREFKNSEKPIEKATRFYISSLEANSTIFQKAIRSHWAIENKLHWTLDVAFGEDASRKRTRNTAQNFSILHKIGLNLMKNEKSCKLGVKSKRLKARWDNLYLIKVLSLMRV